MADSSPSIVDWVKLIESDYAKVIFKNVKKHYSPAADILCSFEISDDIKPSSNDYVGLFAVGFGDLSQCIALQNVKEEKKQDVVFTAEQLPKKKMDYYQFLYVAENDAIYGASIPFLLQDSGEDVVTDEDFLVINPPEEVPDEKLVVTEEKENLAEMPIEFNFEELTKICKLVEEHRMNFAYPNVSSDENSCLTEKHVLLCQQCEQYEQQLKEKDGIIVELNTVLEEMRQRVKTAGSKEVTDLITIFAHSEKVKQLKAENEKLQAELQDLKNFSSCYVDTKAMLDALEDSKQLCILEMKRLQEQNSKLENDLHETEKRYASLEERYIELELPMLEENEKSSMLAEELQKKKCDNCAKEKDKSSRLADELQKQKCDKCAKLENVLHETKNEYETLKARFIELENLHIVEENKKFSTLAEEFLKIKCDNCAKLEYVLHENEREYGALQERLVELDMCMSKEKEKCSMLTEELQKQKCDNCAKLVFQLDDAHTENFKLHSHLKEVEASELELKQGFQKLVAEERNFYVSQLNAFKSEKEKLETKSNQLKMDVILLKTASCSPDLTKQDKAIQLDQKSFEVAKAASVVEKMRIELEKKEAAHSMEMKEMRLRLEEAAELYKKQFLEITVLKKMLKKYKNNTPKRDCQVDVKTALTGATESNSSGNYTFGELVSNNSTLKAAEREAAASSMQSSNIEILNGHDYCKRSCGLFPSQKQYQPSNGVEEKAAQYASDKQEDASLKLDTTACHICSETFPIIGNDNRFLLHHLDVVHSQMPCPVCGMLFGADLPPQYFKCHIDAHFN